MGIMDFLFGTEDQTVMDPQIKRARDFLLDQMMQQYQAGPINVPQYMAVAPEAQYSGTNALLSSLGLEPVIAPALPTTNVGGIDVYTSQPFQEQIEQSYAERYPEQYDFLRSFYMDPVTGQGRPSSVFGSEPMQPQPFNSSGGDNDDDALELHYSIFPDERPRTGPYADPNKPSGITYSGDYPTMGSMPAIRGYTTPDRGPVGNFVDDLTSAGRGIARDVGRIASSGGIIGALLGGGR